jgi:hypothetical protein
VKILQDMLKWKGENTTGYVEMEGWKYYRIRWNGRVKVLILF